MDNAKTPDKNEPHVFEPSPDVPIVMPRTGTMGQQGLPGQGTGLGTTSGSKCTICGKPSTDPNHVAGQADADAESPRWGM